MKTPPTEVLAVAFPGMAQRKKESPRKKAGVQSLDQCPRVRFEVVTQTGRCEAFSAQRSGPAYALDAAALESAIPKTLADFIRSTVKRAS